ncbi:MAG: NADH-quinone oxidoreductase subunit J family protein [Candidatus Hodarchaeales archaeon]|jgi:NADH:ubiquinone oxidoreductase subunit 6 (subunit J)
MAYLFPPELFEMLEFLVLLILVLYTIGSAYLAVSVKSVYHAVLWLVFCFLGVGMIFLLFAESALLLVIQIIVYAGGITVLLLFAITLSGREAMFEKEGKVKLLDWRLSFAGAFLLLMIAVYTISQVANAFWTIPDLSSKPLDSTIIATLSEQLFTVHGATLIALGLVVLGAMLGSVYLVKKEVENV